jgi:hypothetical protein
VIDAPSVIIDRFSAKIDAIWYHPIRAGGLMEWAVQPVWRCEASAPWVVLLEVNPDVDPVSHMSL